MLRLRFSDFREKEPEAGEEVLLESEKVELLKMRFTTDDQMALALKGKQKTLLLNKRVPEREIARFID